MLPGLGAGEAEFGLGQWRELGLQARHLTDGRHRPVTRDHQIRVVFLAAVGALGDDTDDAAAVVTDEVDDRVLVLDGQVPREKLVDVAERHADGDRVLVGTRRDVPPLGPDLMQEPQFLERRIGLEAHHVAARDELPLTHPLEDDRLETLHPKETSEHEPDDSTTAEHDFHASTLTRLVRPCEQRFAEPRGPSPARVHGVPSRSRAAHGGGGQ